MLLQIAALASHFSCGVQVHDHLVCYEFAKVHGDVLH